jgi:MerR family transcriptional regulator/heat shock protein HspR
MNSPILPRDLVAEHLAVPSAWLLRLEARGLVDCRRQEGVEGYGPAEIRRLWTIVSLHRDLGINLAGIEAVLKLRGHLDEVYRCLDRLAADLRQAVESGAGLETDWEE